MTERYNRLYFNRLNRIIYQKLIPGGQAGLILNNSILVPSDKGVRHIVILKALP